MTAVHAATAPVYRIDRFVVPPAALDAFMDRVQRTQAALGGLAGCRTNLVLNSREGDAGRVVTIVEWESSAAFDAAKAVMMKKYAAEGFDPAAFIRGNGIQADLGVYSAVAN